MAVSGESGNSSKITISKLEEQFANHDEHELLRLLHDYITTHEDMGLSAAKALINIVANSHPDTTLQESAVKFVDIIFEDKMNKKEFQKSDYYIDKIIQGRASKGDDGVSR